MGREPPALHVGPQGVTLAWREALGICFARYPTWARAEPQETGFLDRIESEVQGGPAMGQSRSAPLVAFADERGAHAAEVGADASGRALHVPGGIGAVALAGDRLFAETATALASAEPTRPGMPATVSEHERDLGGSLLLAAAQLRDESILVHCVEGAEAYRVQCVGPRGSVAVRHRAGRPIRSLHVGAAGSRMALALGLEGGAVRLGLLGPGGRVTERPHEVFPTQLGPLDSPRVIWTQQGFTVLARASATGQLHARAVGGKDSTFTLPEVGPDYSVAYRAEHLYTAERTADAGGREFTLWCCEQHGRGERRRQARIEIDGAQGRRQWRRAIARVAEVKQRLSAASDYRGRATPVFSAGPAGLESRFESASLRLRVEPWERGFRLELAWDHAILRRHTHTLDRALAWLRRLRPSVRRADAQTQSWARRTLADLRGAVLLSAVNEPAGGRALAAALPELPDAADLEGWLRKVAASTRS